MTNFKKSLAGGQKGEIGRKLDYTPMDGLRTKRRYYCEQADKTGVS